MGLELVNEQLHEGACRVTGPPGCMGMQTEQELSKQRELLCFALPALAREPAGPCLTERQSQPGQGRLLIKSWFS